MWEDINQQVRALIDRVQAKLDRQQSRPVSTESLKEPLRRAFAAYRLVRLARKTQTEAGKELGVSQKTISHDLKAVREWIVAGNVLPKELAAPPPRPKVIAMDPRKLERGPRRRG
jgi:hypothetical protein